MLINPTQVMVLLPFRMLTSFVSNLALSQHTFLSAHYNEKPRFLTLYFKLTLSSFKTLTCSLTNENCVFNILRIMMGTQTK